MPSLAKPALDAVMSDEIQLIPDKFKNTYRHWMENVRDWCISRQLWWGHRIPAYFYGPGEHDYVVALSAEEALIKARVASGRKDLTAADLQQDPDCLDTWFSSWLWPLSVFDGIRNPENPEIQYYYPTQDLVTAPEILFFWVARMAMAGYEYAGKRPFERVYLTGIVRDKLGRKMSKSLGNSPDPIALMDTYGADGVRMGMLLTSPAGNDLPFDESLCEQGRNFTNKVWNALRLVKGWTASDDAPADEAAEWAVLWFRALFDAELAELQRDYDRYALSEALMRLYKLTWNSFCAWYLELVKPAYGQPISSGVYRATVAYFEELMAALHPFMPFLTEEVWHLLSDRAESDFLDFAAYPTSGGTAYDPAEFASVEAHVVALRTFRIEKNIAFKLALTADAAQKPAGWPAIAKLTQTLWGSAEGGLPLRAGTAELRVLVEADTVDVEAERAKAQNEIEYYSGFKRSIEAKLSNEKFVSGAPSAVVEAERKKLADAEVKIEIAQKLLAALARN
jgi:valyl-tRNA synthetase